MRAYNGALLLCVGAAAAPYPTPNPSSTRMGFLGGPPTTALMRKAKQLLEALPLSKQIEIVSAEATGTSAFTPPPTKMTDEQVLAELRASQAWLATEATKTNELTANFSDIAAWDPQTMFQPQLAQALVQQLELYVTFVSMRASVRQQIQTLVAAGTPPVAPTTTPPSFCDAFTTKATVRRAFHTLSSDEQAEFKRVYKLLKRVDGATGRARYGSGYSSLVEIMANHLATSYALPCDGGHAGPAFVPYHRSLGLKMQQSFDAVTRGAFGAVPYWDLALELTVFGSGHMDQSPTVRTFGGVGKVEHDYVIQDMFSDGSGTWSVPLADSTITNQSNAYGFMRSQGNIASNSEHARYGFVYDTQFTDSFYVWGKLIESIIKDSEDAETADSLINALWGLHIFPHALAGARIPGYTEADYTTRYGTTAFPSQPGNPTWWASAPALVRHTLYMAAAAGLATDTTNGVYTYESSDTCTSKGPLGCLATVNGLTGLTGASAALWNIYALPGFTPGSASDMLDVNGPNDPLFVMHHNNMDRLAMEWQAGQVTKGLATYDSDCNWKNYSDLANPGGSKCSLHCTDCIIDYGDMQRKAGYTEYFAGIYSNVPAPNLPTVQQAMTLSNVPYTYDTICPILTVDPPEPSPAPGRGELCDPVSGCADGLECTCAPKSRRLPLFASVPVACVCA